MTSPPPGTAEAPPGLGVRRTARDCLPKLGPRHASPHPETAIATLAYESFVAGTSGSSLLDAARALQFQPALQLAPPLDRYDDRPHSAALGEHALLGLAFRKARL